MFRALYTPVFTGILSPLFDDTATTTERVWLLATGYWNNDGAWDNSAVWTNEG